MNTPFIPSFYLSKGAKEGRRRRNLNGLFISGRGGWSGKQRGKRREIRKENPHLQLRELYERSKRKDRRERQREGGRGRLRVQRKREANREGREIESRASKRGRVVRAGQCWVSYN